MRRTLLLAPILLASGCAAFTSAKALSVKKGMTPAEVRAVLGEPSTIERLPGREAWRYRTDGVLSGPGVIIVVFKRGAVEARFDYEQAYQDALIDWGVPLIDPRAAIAAPRTGNRLIRPSPGASAPGASERLIRDDGTAR